MTDEEADAEVRLILSQVERERFVEIIADPPTANPALRAAFARHSALVRSEE